MTSLAILAIVFCLIVAFAPAILITAQEFLAKRRRNRDAPATLWWREQLRLCHSFWVHDEVTQETFDQAVRVYTQKKVERELLAEQKRHERAVANIINQSEG